MRGSYFDGTLLGFIGNRLLAWLLTIITLGIAAPWAVCMKKQWELEHTVVNNHRLKFTGNAAEAIGTWILYLIVTYAALAGAALLLWNLEDSPGSTRIVVGILIWIAILLYIPFTKIQIMKWITKYTVFDNRGARSIGIEEPVQVSSVSQEISQPQRAEVPVYTPAQGAHPSDNHILDTPLFLAGATLLSVVGLGTIIFTDHFVPGLVVVVLGVGLLIMSYIHQ